MIDFSKKHRPLRQRFNPWNSKDDILEAFNKIFSKFSKSHLVVSYRSDGMPTIPEILTLMKKYKKNVTLFSYGEYRYVLSHNGNSQEILIIGYD
jgi:diaminopimelate decarboxylase